MGALYHDRSDAVSVAEHLLQLDQCYRRQQTAAEQHEIAPLQTLAVSALQSGEAGQPVHAALSFSLQAGDRLLLNGPSGSGKNHTAGYAGRTAPGSAGWDFSERSGHRCVPSAGLVPADRLSVAET